MKRIAFIVLLFFTTLILANAQDCTGSLVVLMSGASSSDSLNIEAQATSISCATEDGGNINLIVNGGNGGYQFDWADGVMAENFRDSLGTGSYIVTVTDSQGCQEIVELSIDLLNPENTTLAEISGCGNCMMTDGSSTYFFNHQNEYIAELIDQADGSVGLGDTELCLNKEDGPGDCNGNPYLERSWSINPSENESACVKLYFDQAEFEALANELPDIPAPTPAFLVQNDMLCLTGFTGGAENCDDYISAQTYSQTDADPLKIVLEDSIQSIWSVEVCLDEYATFYFHICNYALPVELLSFNVEKDGKDNAVQWQTERESEIKYYEVEISRNTKSWKTSERKMAMNDVNNSNHYFLTHKNPGKGIYYYRLKIIENSNERSYSDVIAINRRSSRDEKFYPTLFSNQVTYELYLKKADYIDFKFINDIGKVVHFESVYCSSGSTTHTFDLSHLPAAPYFVSTTARTGKERLTYKLIKAKK